MKSFEPIFNKLSELFINNLPRYVQKINERFNDGLLIKDFENQNLFSLSNKLPCFSFSEETAEYTDKDRIIENTVFEVGFSIKLMPAEEQRVIFFWRYVEAIQDMLEDFECCDAWNRVYINRVSKNTVYLRIVA